MILVLVQLFVISAAAAGVPASSVEKMKAAVNGTEAKTSGAAEGSAAAVNAENEKKAKEAEAAAAAEAAARKLPRRRKKSPINSGRQQTSALQVMS